VCRFNDLADVEQAVDEYGGEVAAIIVEPIPHNIGTVLPQPGFLEALRAICDRNGIVLIFDEVITGFRHHLGGYQTICEVMPDLTALGKAVANGYPLGALGGRAELMDRIAAEGSRQVFAAGTYNGHPAVAAAALETIRKLEQEPVHEHIYRLGERARTELAALYAELGIQVVVSGFGSVFVTYFLEPPVISYDDLLRNDADMFVGYRRELIRRGVFELPLNLKRNHVSYAHTDADIDLLLEETKPAVQLAAQKLARAG
jgi:glutamate-1-semialdehyde 2,1-aminomutase